MPAQKDKAAILVAGDWAVRLHPKWLHLVRAKSTPPSVLTPSSKVIWFGADVRPGHTAHRPLTLRSCTALASLL